MAFYIYDISFLIVFTLFVIVFLYRHRHNLKREGIMYLYRTQIGVKLINYVGEKYKKTLKVFGILSIISGYFLMALVVYLFGQLVYIYLFVPKAVQAIKVPPIMPLIPYIDKAVAMEFLPPFYFTYWIIAIAVIAIFHEFAHGIIAKRYDVKVKTTGFGFLGPFLAAFVEPDEEEMQKKPKFQQMSILAAGTFTNLILAIIFFLILAGFFVLAYAPAGAVFNTYTMQKVNISSLTEIEDYSINNTSSQMILEILNKNNITDSYQFDGLKYILIKTGKTKYYVPIETLKTQLEQNPDSVIVFSDLPALTNGLEGFIIQIDDKEIKNYQDLAEILKPLKPGNEIIIKTKIFNESKEEIKEYKITLGEDPNEKGRGVLGIGFLSTNGFGIKSIIYNFFTFFKQPTTYYEPKFNVELVIFLYNLIWWLALINFSVAVMNMLPVGIFDGGRFFMLTVWAITGKEKFSEKTYKFATYLILFLLLVIMIGWARAVF